MSLDRIKLNVNVAIIDVIKEPVTTNHSPLHPYIYVYVDEYVLFMKSTKSLILFYFYFPSKQEDTILQLTSHITRKYGAAVIYAW